MKISVGMPVKGYSLWDGSFVYGYVIRITDKGRVFIKRIRNGSWVIDEMYTSRKITPLRIVLHLTGI